ncbi:MAG: response regulator receiver protein, partial [Oscillospiraceae bacterium]|nr:response regulator receiver protein [Oscillospiraceae bacterium]
MESALIVSSTDKSASYFAELLNAASVKHIAALPSCGEARRLLMERDFDLVIVNAPLRDESGESMSRHIASKSMSQVILVVKSEYFEAVSAVCEEDGVLTVSKPVNRAVFWSALKLASSAQSRLTRVHAENSRLKQK